MLGIPTSFIWIWIAAIIAAVLFLMRRKQPPAANTEHLAMTVWAAFGPYSSAKDAEELLDRSARAVFRPEDYGKHADWVRGHGEKFRQWESLGGFEKHQAFMRRHFLTVARGTDFDQACQRLRAEAQKLGLEAMDHINQDFLDSTGHRLEAARDPDGTLRFEYKQTWPDAQIREHQESLVANIAEAIGQKLLTSSSETGVAMREFLVDVGRVHLGRNLEEAGDIGGMWLRCCDLLREHPESETAKAFKVHNDAWDAESPGEKRDI